MIKNQHFNENFNIFQASAGSGKTYNLAKEYIRICLQYVDKRIYRNILAITFTKKAVGEMKSRILFFLKELAEGKNTDLFNYFSQKYGKEELQKRSQIILEQIHHDYNNFSVYTIDSFFSLIAKGFATELNIPIDSQMELDDSVMMDNIIDILLSKVGQNQDKTITEFLLKFVYSKMDEERSWKIKEVLTDNGKEIFSEKAKEHLEKLKNLDLEEFESLIKKIEEEEQKYCNQIKKIAQNMLAIFEENGLKKEDFYGGYLWDWYKKVEIEKEIDFKTIQNIQKSTDEEKFYAKSLSNEKKAIIDSLTENIKNSYFQIKEAHKYWVSYKAIKQNLYSVALFQQMKIIQEELKNKEQTLHLSEIAMKLHEIVSQEPIAFIYEKISLRYAFLFIDEFQDTSRMQWEILKPFVNDIISSEVKTGIAGKVFIFGDEKQAIYRFRNGDVQQMLEFSENQDIKKIPLTTNYRSKWHIVDFNNLYFDHLKEEEGLIGKIYKNAKQDSKNDGGCVSLTTIEKDADNQTYNKVVLSKIKYVQSLGYQYKDIAIIVRKKKYGQEIIQHLIQNDIPTTSAEALLLSKNENIQFVLALLQYIENENNMLSLLKILTFLTQRHEKLDLQTLLSVKNLRNNKLQNAYLQQILKQILSQYYEDFKIEDISRCNLYEQIEMILRIFFKEESQNPYLLSLLNFVLEFNNQNQYPQSYFFKYFDQKKPTISNPENINAVTIITTHKSKGLEFPVVIYPIYKETTQLKKDWVDVSQEMNLSIESAYIKYKKELNNSFFAENYAQEQILSEMDNKNVDYVVFTRAEDWLFLIKKPEKEDDKLVNFFKNRLNSESVSDKDNEQINCYFYGNQNQAGEEREEKQNQQLENIQSVPILAQFSTNGKNAVNIEQETLWGIKVHNYLSQIVHREDIQKVEKRIEKDVQLSAEEKEKMLSAIEQVCCGQYSDLLFGTENCIIKNEVEIWQANNNVLRLDKLIINGKYADIVDYKTGLPKKEHQEQINNYATIVEKMGYKVRKTQIIYIE